MNAENRSLDLESGAVFVVRQSEPKRSCFWPSLCAVALLGLLAVSSYLALCQLGVLPSKQETSLNSKTDPAQDANNGSAVTTVPGSAGLLHLMKQVGNDPRRRIAAHLTASKTAKAKKVIWQNEADSTFTQGVEFRDNHLIIKTPGQYFVYTQVVFYSVGCQEQTIYLNHELTKLSSDYPDEALLLKATKSACHYGQHGAPWFKTSYHGAIFEFEEGDQIFSRVSEEVVTYVDTTQGRSFFGIFAL
ncbi:tumor necrosis factor-like [Carcharodon carcharias]|uniref:lymphotoxin alpha-c2 n=1 Tax=Carcharodon carcharias TaxID=13397 RepID=UPI001B7DA7A4|nr:lymphotoxin alpha-c2 [Carcharodon carcharias]